MILMDSHMILLEGHMILVIDHMILRRTVKGHMVQCLCIAFSACHKKMLYSSKNLCAHFKVNWTCYAIEVSDWAIKIILPCPVWI